MPFLAVSLFYAAVRHVLARGRIRSLKYRTESPFYFEEWEKPNLCRKRFIFVGAFAEENFQSSTFGCKGDLFSRFLILSIASYREITMTL